MDLITAYNTVDDILNSISSICGYDPMNMFRVGDIVYCSHFICLSENGEMTMIHSATALKLAEGSNQTVVGYYI